MACCSPFTTARVNPIGNASGIDLTGKAVNDGFNGTGLKGLDFELQFHAMPSLNRLHFGARRHLFEDLFDIDFDGIGHETVVTENDPQRFEPGQLL